MIISIYIKVLLGNIIEGKDEITLEKHVAGREMSLTGSVVVPAPAQGAL